METEDVYTITGGPLKPHEYVVVRREMTAADEAFIQNHATTLTGPKKSPKIEMTIGDIKLATLKRMIVSWRLVKTVKSPVDGSEREVDIPLSDEAIENLPRRVSAFLNKEIDKLNPEDEEDEEAFTHAANGRSGGSSKTERNHHPRS